MKINGKHIIFTLILVALATLCKFFFGPDLAWSGFSPVIAIALFSGMIVKDKNYSFLLPLLALFLSDVAIQILFKMDLFPYAGFYSGQWLNYCILLLSTLLGWMLKGRTYTSLLAGAVLAPTIFFLASNFSVFLGAEGSYPRSFSGLMTCYAAGLPFYKNALISTLVFFPVVLITYNSMLRDRKSLTIAS